MWKAARAGSSASTYFPPAHIKIPTTENYLTLVDGGLFNNSPAMSTYVEALKSYPDKKYTIVSLGTGALKKSYPYNEVKNWGIAHWAIPMSGIMLNAQAETADYHLNKLLNDDNETDYYRYQPHLKPHHEASDDTNEKNIAELIEITNDFIVDRTAEIDTLCQKLLDNKGM